MAGRIAHVARGVGYRVGNSFRGVRRWIRRGYRRWDNDVLITKPDPECPYTGHPEHGPDDQCFGHMVVTHWRRPLLRDMFRDPLRKLRLRTPVDRMTLDEVLRLRSPDGYRIRTPEQILRLRPVRRGRGHPVWEPKADPRFERARPWVYLAGLHEEYGVPLEVRALKHLGGRNAGVRRVEAAKRGAGRAGVKIRAWTI